MPDHHILTFRKLNRLRIYQIKNLLDACSKTESLLPGYPLHEPDTLHYLACRGRQIIGALAICRIDAGYCEATAFVVPEYRRQGLFRQLLEKALPDYEDDDILFVCAGALPDSPWSDEFPISLPAMAALNALGAEPESMELLMECSVATDFFPQPLKHPDLTIDIRRTGETAIDITLLKDNLAIGRAGLAVFHCGLGILHGIEIDEPLRGTGCGGDFMQLILAELSRLHCETVSLQVHGDNTAALNLYKKTGFRICKILSYYLY